MTTDSTCQPLKRTVMRRIKWFWQDRGEWVVAPVLGLMLIALGYSIRSAADHDQVVEVVIRAQQERELVAAAHERDIAARQLTWEHERDYFRQNAEAKNEQIVELSSAVARMGLETSTTAKTAVDAAKTATETNKVLREGAAAKP
jgi:uncharacterized membrane protein